MRLNKKTAEKCPICRGFIDTYKGKKRCYTCNPRK